MLWLTGGADHGLSLHLIDRAECLAPLLDDAAGTRCYEGHEVILEARMIDERIGEQPPDDVLVLVLAQYLGDQ